jgi:hypothetical protein
MLGTECLIFDGPNCIVIAIFHRTLQPSMSFSGSCVSQGSNEGEAIGTTRQHCHVFPLLPAAFKFFQMLQVSIQSC